MDVAAFTAVLYLTGGATNPFAWFYLVPVIITATVLPRRFAWAMAAITTLCYTLLLLYYVPLPGMGSMHHDGFGLHIFGMWFGFVLIAGLIAHFVVDMAYSLHERDRKLAEIREQALRDERLIALGTLAAGAAHELGTPLATMAILGKEMQEEYPLDRYPELHDRLAIFKEQIARCKDALSVISASAGEARAESGHPMSVQDYLKELLRQWRKQRPAVLLQYHQQAHGAGSRIIAERTLNQALINVLNNAADASPERIEVDASWNADRLVLNVSDRGPGLDLDATHTAGKSPFSTKEQGLGIGLFLAQATIRRLGGKIALSNIEGGGACTRIVLPLLSDSRTVEA
jgi:two-component system sensor histidine kinase RegB